MRCPKPTRIVDPAYRKSARGRKCDVPGCDDMETVVLAHIRMPENSGTGLKPPDDESLFLCVRHHDEFDGRIRPEDFPPMKYGERAMWIVRNIVIPQHRAEYRKWKASQ